MSETNKSNLLKSLKTISFTLFLLVSIMILTGFSFFMSVHRGAWGALPEKIDLYNIEQDEASVIFAANNELLGKYYTHNRQPITYGLIPENLINALVATEDARFFNHNGVDLRSTMRVAFKSILLGDKSSGGGSTISQQIAKNLFPRQEHGAFTMPVNKAKEVIIALRLESMYSKQRILALYLNTVPFGDNTYGIESAARRFFSKSAKELSVEESAVLVGMLKATHSYNPRFFPENSLERRNIVLSQMNRYGYLSDNAYDSLVSTPIQLNLTSLSPENGPAPYFREEVKRTVNKWLKEFNHRNGTTYNLYTSGLKIYTTLDYDMQVLAEESVSHHMKGLQKQYDTDFNRKQLATTNREFRKLVSRSSLFKKLLSQGLTTKQAYDSLSVKRPTKIWDWEGTQVKNMSVIDSIAHYQKLLNTGMLSLDPRSGAVKAWVGGINYSHYKFDHISQSQRQVGSTFKPLVYASALERGISACKYYNPQREVYKEYDNWAPANSGDDNKLYTMRGALASSVNTVAVKVMNESGLDGVLNLAAKMGINDVPEVPSLALGTAEMSILELANAYTAFINDGRTAKPFYIRSIKDSKGRELASFGPEISNNRVISPNTEQLMLEMLKGVVDEGTAGRLRWKYGLENDIAGKTGTTQDNKDGWFVGLTPRLITVTWVGTDNYNLGFESTKFGQGANTALPIFAELMQRMNKDDQFNLITKARFRSPSFFTMEQLDCPAETSWAYLEPIIPETKTKLKTFKTRNSKMLKPKSKFLSGLNENSKSETEEPTTTGRNK